MSSIQSVVRGPKSLSVKTRAITRTMTVATHVATLPKGSRLIQLVLTGTASDATAASVSVGTDATPTELVNAVSVLAGGVGNGVTNLTGVAGVMGVVLTADTPIFVQYTESGTPSTVGTWFLHIHYTTGNLVNNDAS